MTSSLTHSVANASRASFAVVTASRAVKQPAVFGSRRTPWASRTSMIEPRASGATRRSATVTSSLPLAAMASPSTSRLVKPPVPSSRRDEKRTSAICIGSASLNGGEDLDPGTVVDLGALPLGAGDDLGVDGHGDAPAAGGEVEGVEQGGDGGAGLQVAGLAVDDDAHEALGVRRWALGRRALSNRSAAKGSTSAGGSSPLSTAAIASAVMGASRMPLRK